jgi:branched-chain amino acid transport system permease protein
MINDEFIIYHSSFIIKKMNKKYISYLLIALPLLLPIITDNQYYIHGVVCRIIIYAILVASLDLIVGYIGDVSIGHAGFFAIGAYTVAILTARPELNSESTLHYFPQLPYGIALIIGILLSGLAGFILGFPALRLTGPYLAVVTIAYGLLIYTVINEQETLTNGTKGITMRTLELGGFSFAGNNLLYLVYPMLILALLVIRNLTKSFWGRAFEAIKYSEVAAANSGISKSYYKIWAFVISAGIAGLAGGLFAQLDAYISPNTFSYNFSVEMLIALIVGGTQSITGNILGVSVYVLLPDLFNRFNDYRLIVFGIALLLVLFFLPKGLAGLVSKFMAKYAHFFSNEKNESERLIDLKQRSENVDLWNEMPQSTSDDILKAHHLTMRFGGLTAVNQLDMTVKRGTVHGLIGPNGSGKSTTVNLLTGIYKPVDGTMTALGIDLKPMHTYQRAKLGIARTFQNLQLFSDMTALQNVMVGMHNSFKSNLLGIIFGTKACRNEEALIEAKAFKWLQFVGLESVAFEQAKNLAYGQARLLEIARALASNPALLLLDEPAAGLTSGEIEKINALILKMKDAGISILLIEHHMDMISAVSDEVTVLDFGKKIAEGAYQTIRNDPQVIRAYLGTEG